MLNRKQNFFCRVFSLFFIVLMLFPNSVLLAVDPVKTTEKGTVSVTKKIANGFVWTGKAIYKSIDFVVGEVLRPIEPVTHWITSKIGVTTVEKSS